MLRTSSLAGLALLLSCSSPRTPSPRPPSSLAPDPCKDTVSMHKDAEELHAEGWLDRSLLAIRGANQVCPREAASLLALELSILSEVRSDPELRQVMTRARSTPSLPPEALAALDAAEKILATQPEPGEKLLEEAVARPRGSAESRRLFHRAAFALERELGAPLQATLKRTSHDYEVFPVNGHHVAARDLNRIYVMDTIKARPTRVFDTSLEDPSIKDGRLEMRDSGDIVLESWDIETGRLEHRSRVAPSYPVPKAVRGGPGKETEPPVDVLHHGKTKRGDLEFAAYTNNTLHIFDGSTRQELASLPALVYRRAHDNDGSQDSIIWKESSDGKWLAWLVPAPEDTTAVSLHDLVQRRPAGTLKCDIGRLSYGLTFSDDSSLVAVSNDGGHCVWDRKTGRPLVVNKETGGHTLQISPDKKYLSMIPMFSTTLSLFSLPDGKQVASMEVADCRPEAQSIAGIAGDELLWFRKGNLLRLGGMGDVIKLTLNKDGTELILARPSGFSHHDGQAEHPLNGPQEGSGTCSGASSFVEGFLVTVGATSRLWDKATRKLLFQDSSLPFLRFVSRQGNSLVFESGGMTDDLSSCVESWAGFPEQMNPGDQVAWDLSSGSVRPGFVSKEPARNAGEHEMKSTSDDRSANLVRTLTRPGHNRLEVTPDGKTVLEQGEFFLKVWDVDTEKVRLNVDLEFYTTIVSDDSRLLAGITNRGVLQLIELATGTMRSADQRFLKGPSWMSFGPGNKWLAVLLGKNAVLVGTDDGKTLGELAVVPDRTSIAVMGGRDVFIQGNSKVGREYLACRIGVHLFPFEVCEGKVLREQQQWDQASETLRTR